jgi:hypothetical protein
MKTKRYFLGALCLLLLANIANAHHSTGNYNFDEKARVTIHGTVKYWSFSNPHSFIDVDVSDAAGKVTAYKIFLTSRVALQRYGWRPTSLKVGDMVEIEGSPDRSNPQEIYLQRIVFADGKQWNRSEISL